MFSIGSGTGRILIFTAASIASSIFVNSMQMYDCTVYPAISTMLIMYALIYHAHAHAFVTHQTPSQYRVRLTSLLTSLSSTYPVLLLGSRNSTSLRLTSLTLRDRLTLRRLALGSS